MQSRRNFIKNGCMACMGMSAMGALFESCGVSQMIVSPAIEQQKMMVSLDQFKTAQSLILRNKKLDYDILVVKQGDSYVALQMRCTHNDIALTFSGKKIICNAHGSEFNLQGEVLKAPAAKNLTTYKTTINGQQLIVHLT